MPSEPSRRDFLKTTTATAAGMALLGGVNTAWSSDKKLRLGFIGVGNRGGQLLEPCLKMDDVEVVGLCDVYKPYLDKWGKEVGGNVFATGDFRELISRSDVDAIFVATPDHWHALHTALSCEAGKDVYVEKPLSRTVVEGRRMVNYARRHQRIVQVGTQRRSSTVYPKLVELVQGGGIGKVTSARCYRISNMFPDGIGKAPDCDPPADLNWDLWLGPRAYRPYNPNIAPYKFRWWSDYSSQMGNWGVHYIDVIRWALGEEAPTSLSAHGGRYVLEDSRTIPDTMEAIFEFASGRFLTFSQYEASSGGAMNSGDIELRGTLGTVYADEKSFEVIPAKGGQFNKWEGKIEPQKVVSEENVDLTYRHIRNFLECVRTRQTPNADVEVGHRSTTFALLANIALETKARLDWDQSTERFSNSEVANTLLHYRYRDPWKLKAS
jgi:predicted dehydrogenase